MLAFEVRLELLWNAAFVDDSPLRWIARNSSKPGRPTKPDCWVLHASPSWSTQHLEDSPEQVTRELIASFWDAIKISPQTVSLATAHRWRFALPTERMKQPCLFHEELQLGVCGDWWGGPRVEGAYLGGLAMAEAVRHVAKPVNSSDVRG